MELGKKLDIGWYIRNRVISVTVNEKKIFTCKCTILSDAQPKQEKHREDTKVKLIWREGSKAKFAYRRYCDAVVDSNRVYCRNDRQLWTYDIKCNDWSQLSECLYTSSSLAILDGLLTTIGGTGPLTNELLSLTTEGNEWTEKIFPAMPTKRYFVTAICTQKALIVVGGMGENDEVLAIVEVLIIENRQWSTAVNLPDPMQRHSATICGDQLYMLGGEYNTKSVYTCSVSALLQTCIHKSSLEERTRALSLSNSSSSSGGRGVWSKLPDLPVARSTCVTFCGQLLAIGGEDSDRKPTTAVYIYNPSTNSWNIISHRDGNSKKHTLYSCSS